MAVMQKEAEYPAFPDSVLFIFPLALIGSCGRHAEVETLGKPVKLMRLQQWFKAAFKLLTPHLLRSVGKGSGIS